MNDWQQASELFMPLRLQGVNLQMVCGGGEYEIRIWQSHNLAGERLSEYRVARGVGATFTQAMQKAVELWGENYGN